ncbi:hypothetical protein [Spirilliplanes yamanashiensis]|uniref:hypothetical protein n=1 Tax=Spirilliplanes yamanashiensis TaxID=42233 RepID=UPI00194F16AE|nr:hypothetical protein [Spirilliplanes yamanashiensis]MDP9819378.1 hypothetical protein [Spirilliplanes yamanashiensis]
MNGDMGQYGPVVEVEPHEAAGGALKSIMVQNVGQVSVVVPPGTPDGTFLQVPVPGHAVPVTVQVRLRRPGAVPPPAPYGPPGPQQAYGPPPPQYGPPGPQQQQQYGPPGPPPFGPPQPYPAFGPQAAPKKGRKQQFIALGVAGALVALCCGGVAVFGRDDDKTTTVDGVERVSAGDYQQLLKQSDAALTPAFAAIGQAGATELTAAASLLETESAKLRAAEPPAPAELPHKRLVEGLEDLSVTVAKAGSDKPACPAGPPGATVLGSDEATTVRDAAKALAAADATWTFGAFLPAAPKETNRRLANGAFVKKTSGGRGELTVNNGPDDTTVSLVPKGSKTPAFTVYLRANGKTTVRKIKDGTYTVYTASGKDWNAAKKGFTRDCSFSKFDDTLEYETSDFTYSTWELTLSKSFAGNASSSEVDPGAFPN